MKTLHLPTIGLASLVLVVGCSDQEKTLRQYPSGEKQSEGHLLGGADGKEVGEWIFWHKNGETLEQGLAMAAPKPQLTQPSRLLRGLLPAHH